MKNNSLHEGTARKFAAILLCGLLSLGATAVAAHAPQGGSSYESSQSQRTVKGTVVDEAGDPIVGASVMVQGTSNGVATDISGTFSISAPASAVLEVSFIGYHKAEVSVAGKDRVKVTLTPSSEQLSEVVVTALGIKREKRALGYAMQEVDPESLTENKSLSLSNMLQGKIAGVQINQSGSGMGGSTRVVLRGLNSLSGNNQPLWVVDGIPINNDTDGDVTEYGGLDLSSAASQINPNDIESISVLKGANAAALYGSRAQNGAIIITTKKGKQGQPLSIEYTGNVQFTSIYQPYEYQNVYGQGSAGVFSNEARGSWGPRMTGQMVDSWRKFYYDDANAGQYALLPQDDYIKDFFESGIEYSNTLTASAGGEHVMP